MIALGRIRESGTINSKAKDGAADQHDNTTPDIQDYFMVLSENSLCVIRPLNMAETHYFEP